MKESTTKYAGMTWIDTYEDDEYDILLRECYEKSKVPKEQGQKRHKWRCIYCEEVFQCRPSLNYHRHKVCQTVGQPLKQYPIVGKGQRIVMKDQQAIVKGQSGKRKGRMASGEEDGWPPTIGDGLEVEYLLEFLPGTQTHQAPVMTSPNISNVLLEGRGVSSSGERGPVCNLGVFEGTETIDTTGLAMVSENHEHVEVEGDGEGHALEVENEEWGWSPLFCLLRDFPEFRPPDFPQRPWKHTREEFDVIHKFLKDRKAHRTKPLRPPLIVLALKVTWHFHFGNGSSIIEHYPKLVEKLEHVSQDKEFVDNLSRMQHLMRERDGWMTGYANILFLKIPDGYRDEKQSTLEHDVSSFKATSESLEHQKVVKKVLESLIGVACCALEHMWHPDEDMWHSPRKYDKILTSLIHEWEIQCRDQENNYTGFTLEELKHGILENDIQYPNLLNGSLEPLRIQSPTERCYSSFQFRAPPGFQTSIHEIYTKLRTFVNQNWAVALVKSAPPTSLNTAHQTVEGCSETSPLYLLVHKSGDVESLSLSAEMFSELEVLFRCGWMMDSG